MPKELKTDDRIQLLTCGECGRKIPCSLIVVYGPEEKEDNGNEYMDCPWKFSIIIAEWKRTS